MSTTPNPLFIATAEIVHLLISFIMFMSLIYTHYISLFSMFIFYAIDLFIDVITYMSLFSED